MKALITYKDWLLLNKGKIRPEIGDKVKISTVGACNFQEKTVKDVWRGINDEVMIRYASSKNTSIKNCYVEIDYNPNEVVVNTEEIVQECGNCIRYNKCSIHDYDNCINYEEVH